MVYQQDFSLKHYSSVLLQWKLIRKFYKTSRSNRIYIVHDVCFSTAVVYFDITDGFKGVKIDGVTRVTKLNRIFWIILLLPKEKKETFWKIVYLSHTHTPIIHFYYIIRLRLRTLHTSQTKHVAAAVAWATGTVIYGVKVRQYLPNIYMVVLHARW
jgi:tRNA G37 N-methylase Trm5